MLHTSLHHFYRPNQNILQSKQYRHRKQLITFTAVVHISSDFFFTLSEALFTLQFFPVPVRIKQRPSVINHFLVQTLLSVTDQDQQGIFHVAVNRDKHRVVCVGELMGGYSAAATHNILVHVGDALRSSRRFYLCPLSQN